MGPGTGSDGRAMKVSGGAFLEGKGPLVPSCRSGWAAWLAKGGSSAKRVRPWGVLGLPVCAALSEPGLDRALGIQDPVPYQILHHMIVTQSMHGAYCACDPSQDGCSNIA